jgi:hypothetical protein
MIEIRSQSFPNVLNAYTVRMAIDIPECSAIRNIGRARTRIRPNMFALDGSRRTLTAKPRRRAVKKAA